MVDVITELERIIEAAENAPPDIHPLTVYYQEISILIGELKAEAAQPKEDCIVCGEPAAVEVPLVELNERIDGEILPPMDRIMIGFCSEHQESDL